MRRHACLTIGCLALSACAEPPPPVAPIVQVAPPPLPPLPPAPPPLLAVPRAEAAPRHRSTPRDPEHPELRSDGKRHAIRRTKDGIVVLSEDRGVIGILKDSKEIHWAGFSADDAVLIARGDSLLRAATPDDAVLGRFDPLGTLDPSAPRIASGGKVVVAAAPDGSLLLVSRDGGKRFVKEKPPAKGPIAEVQVRSDGVIVIAIDRGRIDGSRDEARSMEIHVSRARGAWVKGPMAVKAYGAAIARSGDALVIQVEKKGGKKERLGLDARGKWIRAAYPSPWLELAWTGSWISIQPPSPRPGIPKLLADDGGGLSDLLGVMGGLGARCRGVACLAHRTIVGGPPIAAAFHDGVCANEHVVERKETVDVYDAERGGRGSHPVTHTIRECAKDAPAARAATLLIRASGADPVLSKLPTTCAAGRVLSTDVAAFVHCNGKHQGKSEILHVAASGAITEIGAVAASMKLSHAESASDGTTVLSGNGVAWLCRTSAPACVALPPAGLLAALPVPGGRALVVRRGASDHDLVIELVGEQSAPVPFHLAVQDNVLDVELTAEGYVRLWTSPKLTYLDRKKASRHLVRVDGVLVAQ
jgi:hypothetical protein